jgi:hypothetical protein
MEFCMGINSNLSNWISEEYLESYRAQTLRTKNLQKSPYEHFVLDNFLKDDAFEYLLEKAKVAPREINSSRAGLSKDRPILWGVLNDETAVRMFFGREFREFMGALSGEPTVLKPGALPQLTEFLPGSKGFAMHNDEYELFDLVFLLYLHSGEKINPDAGAFRIHSRDGTDFKTVKNVAPQANRALCFKVSATSFHSVIDMDPMQGRLNLTLDWVLPASARAFQRQNRIQKTA